MCIGNGGSSDDCDNVKDQRSFWHHPWRGICYWLGSQVAHMVKNLPAMKDLGSIPGLGRSSEEGHGNPLQYSCLENSMDRGAWWATVHGVAKSQTCLTDYY
ncbi:hypothetical protein R6Z07F_002972 [Ovis aries]